MPINQKAAYHKCLRQFAVAEQAVGAEVGLFTHTERQMPKHVLIAADFDSGNRDAVGSHLQGVPSVDL